MAKAGVGDLPETVEVRVERTLSKPDEPPIGVHHLVWTRIGSEVVLEMGHFDFPAVVSQIEAVKRDGGQSIALPLRVSHRFLMSKEKFETLVREAYEKLGLSSEKK